MRRDAVLQQRRLEGSDLVVVLGQRRRRRGIHGRHADLEVDRVGGPLDRPRSGHGDRGPGGGPVVSEFDADEADRDHDQGRTHGEHPAHQSGSSCRDDLPHRGGGNPLRSWLSCHHSFVFLRRGRRRRESRGFPSKRRSPNYLSCGTQKLSPPTTANVAAGVRRHGVSELVLRDTSDFDGASSRCQSSESAWVSMSPAIMLTTVGSVNVVTSPE